MRTMFAALAFILALSGHSSAQDLSGDRDTQKSSDSPRECVLAGKSWQECLELEPDASITASMPYQPTVSKEILARQKIYRWHGAWSKSAVDYLKGPYFGG